MSLQAELSLRFAASAFGTTVQATHHGPMRLLKALYPEGPSICHAVLVHPPGGLVCGDRLSLDITASAGAHACISTPGASRFYKRSASAQVPARQRIRLTVAAGARLEWLPLETIAYPGCWADNSLELHLDAGAQCLLWDILALGLDAAEQPFDSVPTGDFLQQLQWPGVWQERMRLRGDDALLLGSPLGLDGQRCLGTLVCASGSPVGRAEAEALSEQLRNSWRGAADAPRVGCSWLDARLLVIRCLGPHAEAVSQRLKACWAVLRQSAWQLPADAPRIWSV
jgi:urease accessory protein